MSVRAVNVRNDLEGRWAQLLDRMAVHADLLAHQGSLVQKTVCGRRYRDAQREEMESYRKTGKPPDRPKYREIVAKGFPRLLVYNCSPRSLKGIRNVPAINTHDVREVISRFERADGLVAKCLIDLVQRPLPPTPEGQERLKMLIESLARALPLLAKMQGLTASLAGFHSKKRIGPTGIERRGGTYVVVMRLREDLGVKAGGLGPIKLAPGYYTYIGTAFGTGGQQARIGRHCNPDTLRKWHIDYVKPAMQMLEVWYTYDLEKRERLWANVVSRMPGAQMPVKGFGSADFVRDRTGARAHFFSFVDRPDLETFRRMVMDEVRKHAAVFGLVIESQ